ncbi:MAG TPA: hypothetical protein VFL91_08535 [Thermomicrobiales bacterium]|nr:hypothetical protein [Thermomicrobiales bacterium]
MLLNGKVVRLDQLTTELAAAGIDVPALGQDGDDLHTYDPQGTYLDLPAAAAPVVAAHVPQPTDQEQDVSQRATLIQTAQAQYQQLQTDIAGWGSYTTAQKQAATLNTMNAVATTMQIARMIARIMTRERS